MGDSRAEHTTSAGVMGEDDPCWGMTGRYDCWLARDVAKPMSGLFGDVGHLRFKESSTSYCGQQTAHFPYFSAFCHLSNSQGGLRVQMVAPRAASIVALPPECCIFV